MLRSDADNPDLVGRAWGCTIPRERQDCLPGRADHEIAQRSHCELGRTRDSLEHLRDEGLVRSVTIAEIIWPWTSVS